MANEEQLGILKRGAEAWNKWRKQHGGEQLRPDLREAWGLSGADLNRADLNRADLGWANLSRVNLSHANLGWANLSEANLTQAYLGQANLSEANLTQAYLGQANLNGANLSQANLREAYLNEAYLGQANLSGANLSGADVSGAYLSGTDVSGADLSGTYLSLANLIDARLDHANLTRAHLWETQRHGWSIRGIICEGAFWDQDGKELTEYGEGEFERLFAEKPRIVLRYTGGISPVDLIALPVIIERLQAEHLDAVLQIRSVQNDAGGASVVITVEDLRDRGTEAFAVEFEKIRAELVTTQHRLQNEERLRISFEAQCQVLVESVIPALAAAPKQQVNNQVNIGQLTAPTIEGLFVSKGDTFNVSGQAGVVGPHGHAHDMSFQQIQGGGLDLPKLTEELGRLRTAMKGETTGTRDEDKAIGAVADAEEAASKGDEPAVLRYLKGAGSWGLGVAEKIGVALTIEALKKAMT
jgi:uncharacterized protein YjbI with pentapeptide repeats